MRVPRASLTTLVLLLAACGRDGLTQAPAAAPELGFSLSVSVSVASHGQSLGLPSPIGVQIGVRDASGAGALVVGGDLVVRDSADSLLAQVPVLGSADGHISVELAWPQSALGRHLDIRLNVLDSSGVVQKVERTLPL